MANNDRSLEHRLDAAAEILRDTIIRQIETNKTLKGLTEQLPQLLKELEIYRSLGSLENVVLYTNYLNDIIIRLQEIDVGPQFLAETMEITQARLRETMPNIFKKVLKEEKTLFTEDDLEWMKGLEKHFQNP